MAAAPPSALAVLLRPLRPCPGLLPLSLPGRVFCTTRVLTRDCRYGGTAHSGEHCGKRLTPGSPFEAVGAHSCGTMDIEELHQIEQRACPGSGTCSGMFTANTMSTAVEALGMSLPGTSTRPAVDAKTNEASPLVLDACRRSARALLNLMKRNIRSRDIMTKKAFENAITVLMALGGSTNGFLHLLALAREAEVDLVIDEFNDIAAKVPFVANLTPGGKYNVVDLDAIGGLPVVMRSLLDAGLLHGDCMTVTGKTCVATLGHCVAPCYPRRVAPCSTRPLCACAGA